MDRPDLLRMVEDAGGAVVVFDDCLGLPHYSMRIEDGPDPIASLARGYLDRPPCARWPDFRSRMQRVRQLVRDFRIDGIIHSGLTFCDYSMFETPLLAATLKEDRVPLLVIENDYLWSDAPRIQTRVEAFLEMVQGEW
jgi:benzoyl-CoA reductase/2-hydroxyglutaryl-CoA dehydratase subunit BcrC/BadD/HgdB